MHCGRLCIAAGYASQMARSDEFPFQRGLFESAAPAFDGQELVYEFAAPSGVHKIASCEVGIDENDPFWLTVAAALAFGEG